VTVIDAWLRLKWPLTNGTGVTLTNEKVRYLFRRYPIRLFEKSSTAFFRKGRDLFMVVSASLLPVNFLRGKESWSIAFNTTAMASIMFSPVAVKGIQALV
jgi:hypothetical protein